jgi:hypothetical protein
VRADLDPGVGHLPYLPGRHQRLARPFRVPRVVPAQLAGDHENSRGEAVPGQRGRHVLSEVGVTIVECETNQVLAGAAAAGR